MTEINAQAKRWENELPRRVTAPLPTAETLAITTPATSQIQQRRYNSKEELAMATTVPTTTAIAGVVEGNLSPPIAFTTSTGKVVDPLHLPTFAPTTGSKSTQSSPPQPQLQGRLKQEPHADVEAGEQPGGMPATMTKRSLPASHETQEREKEEGAAEGNPFDDPPADATRPKEFRCPHVPRMVLVLLVFTALVQGFSSSAISLYINMDSGVAVEDILRYWMYIGLTAWCQPAIGYLSDALVLFGEKRRPLFILAAAGNALIYFCYCAVPGSISTFGRFVTLSLVSQFCMMGLYIPLNGLIVEVGRHDAETEEESMARMSAIMSKTMVWRSIGSLIANILQTCLVFFLSVRGLFGVSSLFFAVLVPLVLVTPRSLFLRSGTQDQNFYKRVAEAGRLVWRSFDIRDVHSDGVCFLIVLLFVFVYTMMPDAGSVYYNYLFAAYTFPTWFYALNSCIGYAGSIAGAYVFSVWMDRRARQETRDGIRTSMFFIFMIGSFAWAFGYVTNLLLCTGFVTETLGIPAGIYIPVDNFFTSLFVRFAFMPTLTMAAEHAPRHFEATTFEVFSVASIGGGTISYKLTSVIVGKLGITRSDYSRLWVLIIISIVLKLVPIPLAYSLPERHNSSNTDEQPTIEGDDGAEEEEEEKKGKADVVAETASEASPTWPPAPAAAATLTTATRYMENESSRISHESDDVSDPSVPLTRNRHNSM